MIGTLKAKLQKREVREVSDTARQYMEYYERAVRHMSGEGVFDSIKQNDEYWRGRQNEAESDTDPASSVNIVHPTIEGQVSLLVEQNLSVTALPVTPSDKPAAEKATAILEFIKSRNKMPRVIERHERRREKYGWGVLRVIFAPKALGGMGLPVIECVANHNVLIDPCITDPLKLQEAEFVIERVVKSIYWARETYGEKADEIQENYYPYGDLDVFGEDQRDGDNPKYVHLLVWTKKDGKLRLVEMSSDGVILSDSGDQESFYAAARYPYFITPLYETEGSLYGMGDAELLAPLQDLINDLDDQIRLNARLTGNPQRLIETSSGIDLDSLTNEPGLNIPVTNINAVRDLQPKDLPDYIVERRNLALQYEVQKISRFSDQMTGTKQSGVDTATESLALQQSGSQGIAFKKFILQDTLSDVFTYAYELCMEFWTKEITMRTSDEESEFYSVNPAELREVPVLRGNDETGTFEETGEKKPAELDITVSVGAGLPSNKAFQYNMMRELTQLGIISPQEFREWLVKSFGLMVDTAMQPVQGAGQNVPNSVPMGSMQGVPNADIEGLNANGNVEQPTPQSMGGGVI